MKRFQTFFIFLSLVATWAAFFASLKFFLWWELSTSIAPDLQEIAGYLSLWWIFAYLIWGAFAVTFLKKYFLFIISLLSLILIGWVYLLWFSNSFSFALIISVVWFLYGLWNVVKNVLISVEIIKTWLSETIVNALAGIIFVVFIIIWSLLGSILFEKMWHDGYLVIIAMLFFTAVASLTLNYNEASFRSLIKNGWKSYFYDRRRSLKKALSLYIPDLKYIVKNYYLIVIVSSFLWAISTIVSQASIEFSVVKIDVEASDATYVLLYSAVWAILWNIVSMKMSKVRWKFFIIFNSLFAILIFLFPYLSVSFSALSWLAILLGMFFWVSSNLIDSYLLKRIWEEDKKEYGSSTYGLVLSIVIFGMMFFSSAILKTFWYSVLMIILGFIILVLGGVLYQKQK